MHWFGVVSYHLNAPVHSNHRDYHCNLCARMHVPKIDWRCWAWDNKRTISSFFMPYKQQQQHPIDDNVSDSINFMGPCNFIASQHSQRIGCSQRNIRSLSLEEYGHLGMPFLRMPPMWFQMFQPLCKNKRNASRIQIGFEINTTNIAGGCAMYCFKNNHTQ